MFTSKRKLSDGEDYDENMNENYDDYNGDYAGE